MRILRVYPFLPPLPGGMEKHIQMLTREQRLLGCDVTVVFNHGDETAKSDIRIFPRLNLRHVKPQPLRDLIFYLAAAVRILLDGVRVDAIHIHGDWSAFLLGRLLGWVAGARVMVASVHGAVRKGLWASIYRRVLSSYAVVYSTGALDAKYLQNAGINHACWQNSGIDSAFFAEGKIISNECLNDVICVANFFPVKNLAFVTEIARQIPELTFLLIGDGPQKQAIEAMCKGKGLMNVNFTGRLSAHEIHKHLLASRVFLSTSFSEGTPTALLEAMACGLPIVTSCSNDYSDLIAAGKNGYVIENFDVQKYVHVLRDLLSDQQLLAEISTRNRAEAQKHAWPNIAERITTWMRAHLLP